MRLEHWLYALPLRLRSLFRRQRVEQDLEEELQYHLEQKIEEYIRQGLTATQARQAALRAMDGLTQRKEECRDMRGISGIENTVQDIRYSLRVLAKSPGFTVVAVLTLALVIGANAVVFGIMNGLVLRPLNVPRIESLYGTQYGADTGFQSYPNYVDLRDRNHSFESLAAFNFAFVGLNTGREAIAATGFATTGNYFDVLGIHPYLGRFFHSSDEHGPNSAPCIVLSYAYWNGHFQADRGVVGRIVQLDKHPFTIIGVAPPNFQGTMLFITPDFFMPIVNQEQMDGVSLDTRGTIHGVFETFGHLKPGVTPAQALADLKSVGGNLEKTWPKEFGQNSYVLQHTTGLTSFGGAVEAFTAGLMLLAGLILLAACGNLGSLFAARAADRSREVALRLALGSGRRRILRQLFTEALLISLMGGAVGVWASIMLLNGLSVWQPFGVPGLHLPVSPDARILIVALVLAVLSGLLFAIVPVRQVLRTDPYQIIKSGRARTVRRWITVRELLLGGQIAICALLVTSSIVAVRGLVRSLYAHFGFEPRNTMILVDMNLAMAGYRGDRATEMQRRMIDAMETIPGVERVGLVNNYPPLVYTAAFRADVFKEETRDLRPSNVAATPYRYDISPGYLDAAGTRLLAGRDLTWHDGKGAPAVALVNRELAGKMFGSVANAVGRYFRILDGTRVQVVGVVEDGKYLSLTEDPQPAMFLPFLQSPSIQASLVVRSDRDPRELAAAMRSKLRELDAGLPPNIQTWNRLLEVVTFPARMATMALGVLGALGAMLSVTGIFGMAAYSVSRRLKELGIRLALGAQRKEVLQAALGRAFKLLAFGSVAGLILGVLASRVLASIVYQATPRDPVVLTGVVLAMALLGLLATWIPAQRALSLDPVTLLREE
jgi:predicted permease